ncbi:1390_t:CDS:2, partial [Ambispora leptoticha]
VARDCGINVPLFTNDPMELGSFISKPSSNFFNRGSFGLDLYGFDKYFEQDPKKWKPWNPKDVSSSLDGIEKKTRSF